MSSDFLVAPTGDSLITRRMPGYQDAPFRRLIDLIHSADAAFTNIETVMGRYQAARTVEPGGGKFSADPRVALDLQRMGFNLAAFANNHTFDFGIEGCFETIDALKTAGFICAGVGRTLAEARSPVFLDARSGRVGLVSCASTFTNGQQASEPGGPGLNPQRFETHHETDQNQLEPVGMTAERKFIFGRQSAQQTEVNKEDLEGNLHSIRQASAASDLTLVSIHTHEEGKESWQPADFIIEFAHACIDVGADMVIGHGPHLLRGLELYKDKPIFYSVGNFIFEFELPLQLPLQLPEDFCSVANFVFKLEYLIRAPADDDWSLPANPSMTTDQIFKWMFPGANRDFWANRLYWETVLPLVTFESRRLVGIELHPVSLGLSFSWRDRGIPRLASPTTGQEILDRMDELSADFGTTIRIRDGVGRVDV